MFSLPILYALIGGYLLGAIPFGFIIAKIMGQGDIRNIGSGNIGATNVLRTGRKDLAFITLLLDAGKAGLAALIFQHVFGMPAGFFAVAWPVGLGAAAVWLASAFITRMSSLSALLAATLSPGIALALGMTHIAIMALGLAVIIIIRHHENIRRILNGTETRIGQKG